LSTAGIEVVKSPADIGEEVVKVLNP